MASHWVQSELEHSSLFSCLRCTAVHVGGARSPMDSPSNIRWSLESQPPNSLPHHGLGISSTSNLALELGVHDGHVPARSCTADRRVAAKSSPNVGTSHYSPALQLLGGRLGNQHVAHVARAHERRRLGCSPDCHGSRPGDQRDRRAGEQSTWHRQ